VAYGVEAGLRYSDASVVEARLRRVEEDLDAALRQLDGRAVIPFNRMAEWGADGRIVPGAAVHSPFIRRKRDLALE
jgi:NAD(P)H dehydrogenase (quinone)